jgi:hypothetical protein
MVFFRFHNQNLSTATPRNAQWLREKVNRDTKPPGSSRRIVEKYNVPASLGMSQPTVKVDKYFTQKLLFSKKNGNLIICFGI